MVLLPRLSSARLISVVIATWDRYPILVRTLPSVLAQEYPPSSFEVVLVDDGSADGTGEWVRSLKPACSLTLIRQERGGPARARNRGIQAASGELLLFLDDDIVCEPKLLEQHAAAHEQQPGCLVHGRIDLAGDSPPTLAAYATRAWYERRHAELAGQATLRPDRITFLNANTTFPAEVMADLGGFDEHIPFPREDFELGLRVWKSGVPVRYQAEARAYELFAKPSALFVADARAHAHADIVICRKHPDERPRSALAASDPPSLAQGVARAVARRLPDGSERLLDPAASLAERHLHRPRARRGGQSLLAIQRQLVYERAAAHQAGSAARLEAEFSRYLPALLYHRVGDPIPGTHPDLTVSVETFTRHLRWLSRRGYTGITPTEWNEWRLGRRLLPRKPILITFDDCYADLTYSALPILRSYGFCATVFVVTQRVGELNDWDGEGGARLGRLMTAGDILRWSRAGIEFGAHGRTHCDLTTLAASEMTQEVVGSRTDLEQILDKPVRAFAYPYGKHDATSLGSVSSTFDAAFVADGEVNVLSTPRHLLRRAVAGRHESGPEIEWRAWTGGRPRTGVRARLSQLG